MRSESVTIRPFFNLPIKLQAIWDQIEVRFSGEEEFTSEQALKVGFSISEAVVSLRFPGSIASMINEDLWTKVSTVVVLWDETRRLTQRLEKWSISDIGDAAVRFVRTSSSRASWLGRKGATLSVYLILDGDYDLGPGMPRRNAHILAMKHFSINKAAPGAEFPVEFWSSANFESQLLPGQTTVAVIGESDDFATESLEDVRIRIAINEALRGAFANARRSKRANVLQDALQADALAQILCMLRSADLTDLPESAPAKRLLKRVRDAVPEAASDISKWRDNQVHAYAQAFCRLNDSGRQFN